MKCKLLLVLALVVPSPLLAIDNPSTAPDATNKNEVVIQFRIFDANKPALALHPDLNSRPVIFLRNLDTNKDELYLGNSENDIKIVPSKDRANFYEITLPKGRLINDLAIDVLEPNTNTAAITKVVTANNIVVYPGASRSLEGFTFPAFAAQLGQYQKLITELTDQFYDRRSEIASFLQNRYAKHLANMQTILDSNRVTFVRPEQRVNARKQLNEVLALYGVRPSHPTLAPKPIVDSQNHDCCGDCCRFGRRR